MVKVNIFLKIKIFVHVSFIWLLLFSEGLFTFSFFNERFVFSQSTFGIFIEWISWKWLFSSSLIFTVFTLSAFYCKATSSSNNFMRHFFMNGFIKLDSFELLGRVDYLWGLLHFKLFLLLLDQVVRKVLLNRVIDVFELFLIDVNRVFLVMLWHLTNHSLIIICVSTNWIFKKRSASWC